MLLCKEKEGTSSKNHPYGLELDRTDTLLPDFLDLYLILQLPQRGVCSSVSLVSIQEQKQNKWKEDRALLLALLLQQLQKEGVKSFKDFERANLIYSLRWRLVLLPETPMHAKGLGGFTHESSLSNCIPVPQTIKISLNWCFCMESCSSKVIVQKPKHDSSNIFCL